ncbi:MAG: hypothetical protein GX969_02665 [Firmicutes bacterium]|nr:hypothetical protein [Bacillota bacterium]
MVRFSMCILILGCLILIVLTGIPVKTTCLGLALGKGIQLETIPQVINKAVLRGKVSDFKIRVINKGPVSIKVIPQIVDLAIDRQGCNVEVPEGAGYPWGLREFTSIYPMEFSLNPGEEKSVQIKIKAPESLTGGRYGIVYFSASTPPAKDKIAMKVRCGSLVFLTVPRTEMYSGEIQNIKFIPGPEHSSCPAGFEVTLKNTGNIHISAEGRVRISDGKKAPADIALKGGTGTILPGGIRLYRAELPKEIPDGNYEITVIFTFQGETIKYQKGFQVKDGQGTFR